MDVHVEQGSLLLIPDHPLQVLPALAVEIGLNEAIVVQQLHYWTKRSKNEEGWVYNTMEEWQEQFPFWSQATIERTWRSLRKKELVEVAQRGGTDRTNHYRLVYESLPRYKFPSRQSDGIKPSDRRDASPQSDGLSSNKQRLRKRKPPQPPEGERSVKKVNRKIVTDDEYTLAAAIVTAFNEIADTRFKVDAHLVPVVCRIREWPDFDAEQHRSIIAAAFAQPHWKGHPSPAVVYGNAAIFETSAERARKESGSRSSRPVARGPITETEKATRAWEAAKKLLEERITKSTFDLWLAPLEVAGEREGKLVLVDTSGNGGIGQWVDRHYRPLVLETAEGFDNLEIVDETQIELEEK